MTYRTIALLVVATLLSTSALAQSQSQSQEQTTSVPAIEQRYAKAYRQQTLGRKLGAMDYQRLARQRAEVQALIERVEAGQNVTPGDVDRALEMAR